MRFPTVLPGLATVVVAMTIAACGGDAPAEDTPAPASETPAVGSDLTDVELEQGIGPIRDLTLGEVDPAMAAAGEEAFALKCSACHKVAERYIGPPLHDVLAKRRPEYVMNMILNANEMVQRHPVAREMLAEYYTPMTIQVVDHDEARALLEYIRTVQSEGGSTQD